MDIAVVITLIAILLGRVLVAGLLVLWGRWVSRRQGGGWWKRLAWAPVVALGVGMVGTGVTVLGLVRSFSTVAAVDPAQKARVLADAISQAMWAIAITAPIEAVLTILAVTAFVVGSVRRPVAR